MTLYCLSYHDVQLFQEYYCDIDNVKYFYGQVVSFSCEVNNSNVDVCNITAGGCVCARVLSCGLSVSRVT